MVARLKQWRLPPIKYKFWLLLLAIWASSNTITAQSITQLEYFFDTDPGFGNGIAVTANANTGELSQSLSLPLTGLDGGFHNLYIRALDDQGTWGLYRKSVFYVVEDISAPGSGAASPLAGAEYWFDTDPGFGNGTPIAIAGSPDNIQQSYAIPLGSLSGGFHSIGIRAQNQNGDWSLYRKSTFYVVEDISAPGSGTASPLAGAEYWFDTDPGHGNGTPLTIAGSPNSTTESYVIPLGSLSGGFHSFGIRVQNENGDWSLYEKKTFYVVEDISAPGTGPVANLSEAEYWFDTDPGPGNGTSLSISGTPSSLTQNFVIPLGSLGAGFHKLGMRIKNENDQWSLYDRRSFYIFEFEPAEPISPLADAEVLFNANLGYGTGNIVPITPTGNPNEYVVEIPGDLASCGITSLSISVKNEDGTYSLYETITDIEVSDSDGPVIRVFEDITVELDENGEGFITIDDVNNGSFDNCELASVELDEPQINFTCDDLGENTVTVTATDTNGTQTTLGVTITVVDVVDPVAITQNITVELGTNGTVSITAAEIDNGSTDNCAVASLSLDVSSFTCNDIGENTVTLSVTDTSGNEDTATATVTVVDNLAPNANATNISITLDETGNASITADDVDNSSDNCGITQKSIDISSFTCDDIGTNTVTLTVEDAQGQTDTDTAIVTVLAPEITTNDITIELDANGEASITPADINGGLSENCGFSEVSLSKSTFNCNDLGSNTVLLLVTYTNGSTGSSPATVTVEDNINPVAITKNITVSLDATGNASITASDVDDNSTDNCNIVSRSIDIDSFTCANLGANTVTLTVEDASGNSDTETATVTVEDNTNPNVLTQPVTIVLDASGNASISVNDVDNGSTDNCGIASMSLSQTTFTCSNLGTNSVTLFVTDQSNNTVNGIAIVTVTEGAANCSSNLDSDGDGVIDALDCAPNDATVSSTTTYYVDNDGDGYGTTPEDICSATAPTGYATIDGDCDDTNPNVNPGETEVPYDGLDNDCDPATLDDDLDQDEFVLANDCDDTDASINSTITYYVDADGDGFGSTLENICSNTAPNGYATVAGDCDDLDPTVNPGATEIAGNGKDDDCNPDTPDSVLDVDNDEDGYTENEGDCDDSDPEINPGAQFFQYSGNAGFTASIVNPLTGAPTDDYNLEVFFTDTRNIMPQFGYPRVIFDYDADGVFNTANDKTIVLTEGDVADTTISDGKLYVGTISPLEANTNYEIFAEVVIDGCSTIFGPFDAPDVLTQSDIEIFANDIVFDNPNPDPSSPLQITATIHNESDLPAENFEVGLLNEWDPSIVYPNKTVPYIAPNSSTQVVWNITTPDEIGWMPMRVSIDITDVIEESNELDNNAVRPFTNGDYNVPGTIEVDVNVTPSVVNIHYPSVKVSGYAYYDGTAVPLEDPSVAGATVDIFIEDLNRTVQVHTNSQGIFSASFPASGNVGTYDVTAEVTDYTLTGLGSDTFEIIYNPITDWRISVSYDDHSILEGETTSGEITVWNAGDQPLPATTVDFTQNGGVPTLPISYNVPALSAGESHTIDLGDMTFTTAGTYNIRGTVDPGNAVTETYDSNNTAIDYLYVKVGLPDLIPSGGPGGSSYFCNANLTPTFSVSNVGNVPAGSFDVEVDIYEGVNFINTETHTISGLNNGQSASFSLASYTYPSEGNYNFDVRVDVPIASNGVVTELREDNNTISYSRTLNECKPDLTVSGCGGDMVVEPIDPGNVASNIYRTTISNNGNATAPGRFNVQFQVVGGASSTVTVIDPLAPGESVSVEVEMVYAGVDVELIVTADTDNIIDELSETNNSNSSQLCHEFYLTPPCGASNDQFWGKNEFIQFSTVVPWIKLHNEYLYAASEVNVKFEVLTPSSGSYIEIGNESEEDILGCHSGCGRSRSYIMDNSFVFSETGEYTFRWTADPDGAYQECDDTNNVYTRTVTVKNLPDMRVLSQFVNPDILNPAVGENVSFDITYENIAFPNTGEEMDFTILVDEVELETIENVPGLLSNTNNTVSVTTPWSSTTAGAHIVRIIIDSKGEIIETNELNNEATRAIIVGEASNLYFKEFGVDDEFPVISQILQINGIVENNGDIDVDAEVEFYYVNNNGQEQYLGKQNISVAAGSEVPVNYNWNVTDTETTIIGRIVNPSEIEFDENDNEASVDIGDGLSVSFDTTEACAATEELGSATANPTGESGNYTYAWNTGETTQAINKPAGTYIVTVTDTDTDEMVEISVTITQDESCIDYCPDDDDKIYPGICGCGTPDTDTDGDGIADCDDAEVNSPCPDDVDENGVSPEGCNSDDTDDDGDGFTENEGDCDDTNPNINPGETEVPYDGLDNDCNPATLDDDLDQDGFVLANDCNDNDDTVNATTTYYVDNDGDGYGTTPEDICSATAPAGYATVDGDCDDTNINVNPGATEVPYDGLDNDCNPATLDDDLDQDGFVLANDCNDNDDTVNATTTYYVDNDGDGYGTTPEDICSATAPAGYATVDGDCDDTNASVNPGETEVPYDGLDNDCDPATLDDDLDQDGFILANDCNDNDDSVNATTTYYVDNDGDGYGTTPEDICSATAPVGYATVDGDCDDTNVNVNPGATEILNNGIDDDCNPATPDGTILEGYVWTGISDSDWENASNWQNNSAPGLSFADEVTIPSSSINFPVLTSDLNIEAGGSLIIDNGAAVNITPNTVLFNNGNVLVNGSMTFESDATGTAYIGSGTGTFTGDVTVERYIPANRAWRQLGTAVNTNTFISNNWQQDTHITGSVSGANGFDATGSGNPSMYSFDNVSYSYAALPNTDATNLNIGTLYHILVRGDRSTDLTNNNAVPSETTLRSTGTLIAENSVGSDFTLSVNVPEQRFISFGNPYQAQVNMNTVLTTGAVNINPTFYWIWDPTIGTRGAYATIIASSGTPSVGLANEYLQSGQAGWVYTNGAGVSSLNFTQSSKSTSTAETLVFKKSKQNTNVSQLNLSLYESNALSLNQSPADGFLVLFSDTGSNDVDGNDALKITNLDENFATNNNGSLLSIENRAFPVTDEEIQLEVNTYRNTNYTIVIETSQIEGIKAYLFDSFKNTHTEINQDGTTNYPYTIDSNLPESMNSDRFTVVFSEISLSDINLSMSKIELYPNPSSIGEFYFNVPKKLDDLEIIIYDALGVTLFEKKGFKAGSKVSIDTGFTQNNGVYFVKLSSKGNSVTKRLIINN